MTDSYPLLTSPTIAADQSGNSWLTPQPMVTSMLPLAKTPTGVESWVAKGSKNVTRLKREWEFLGKHGQFFYLYFCQFLNDDMMNFVSPYCPQAFSNKI